MNAFLQMLGRLAPAAGVLTLAAAPALAADSPLITALKNATYAGIEADPITLNNGRYEGEAFAPGGASRPTVALVDRLLAKGDLGGDGRDDVVVPLVKQAGGSFIYVAAMKLGAGTADNLATLLLGDRVQIRDIEITDGSIALAMVVPGKGDPIAVPSTKRRKTYRLRNGDLIETSSETLGTLSLADVAGPIWVLEKTISAAGQRRSAGNITAHMKDHQITGSAGCNRYFGSISDAGAGRITIGPLATTRMTCPEPVMAEEQAFLGTLEKADHFGFDFGDLVFFGPEGSLIFRPKTDQAPAR